MKQPTSALRLGLLLLLILAIVATVTLLPVKDILAGLRERIEELGVWGPVAMAAAYIPACLLFVPGSVLTLSAGFLFGVVTGAIAVSIGSTLGAAAAFLAGRFLARELIEARVAANPRFQAIDRAVGEKGFLIVLLTRLSPVFPFNLLNYAYGLTRVGFRDYFLASWLGMLPGTLMYVYLGSAVDNLTDLEGGRQRSPAEKALFFVGLLATVAVTVYVTRVARRALATAIPGDEVKTPDPAVETPT